LPLQRLEFSDYFNSSHTKVSSCFFETAVVVSCRRGSNVRRPLAFVPEDQNQFEKIPCEEIFLKFFLWGIFPANNWLCIKETFFADALLFTN
jgi:hypothetical protein